MKMSDFFGWVQANQRKGTLDQMNAAWQNRNQSQIPEPEQPEEKIEEIPVDNEEE
tara:strand:- start:185 stop:349 length:165 start_codon:yes stop_codon:yes gene_type:complete